MNWVLTTDMTDFFSQHFEASTAQQAQQTLTNLAALMTSPQPGGSPPPILTIGQDLLSYLTPEQRSDVIGLGMKMLYRSSGN